MCDIQYEEFDNQERIYKELQDILLEGSSGSKMEDISSEANIEESYNTTVRERDKITYDQQDPPKFSEIYSEFSKNLQEKVKTDSEEFSKELKCKTVSAELIENGSDYSEISDVESIVSEEESPQMLQDTDIQNSEPSGVKRTFRITRNKPDSVDSAKNEVQGGARYCESGNLSLIDEEILSGSLVTNKSPRKVEFDRILLDTSLETKNPKFGTTNTSFDCDFSHGGGSDDSDDYRDVIRRLKMSQKISNSNSGVGKMVTTGTETDATKPGDATVDEQKNLATQADSIYHSLEEKIMPFVRNAHSVELKLRGRLSVFQRACLRQIADQNKLMMKQFGKGRDSFVLLRKKVALLESQKLFLEIKKAEKEKQLTRVKELKVKQEKMLNPPKSVSSGCQCDFLQEEEVDQNLSKKAKQKLRKKLLEARQKQLAKRHSSSQTIPEGYYVCGFCEGDIPDLLRHIHHPFCAEKYRAVHGSTQNSSNNRTQRRAQSGHPRLEDVRKQLEGIHDNDINAMVHVIAGLDHRCVHTECRSRAQRTCSQCQQSLCSIHFSSDPIGQTHQNCQVLLQKQHDPETQRLGKHNPLMKTVEQLRAPQFKDGDALSQGRRSRGRTSQAPSATTSNQGTLLRYQRNKLRQQLKERISSLSDRRAK